MIEQQQFPSRVVTEGLSELDLTTSRRSSPQGVLPPRRSSEISQTEISQRRKMKSIKTHLLPTQTPYRRRSVWTSSRSKPTFAISTVISPRHPTRHPGLGLRRFITPRPILRKMPVVRNAGRVDTGRQSHRTGLGSRTGVFHRERLPGG